MDLKSDISEKLVVLKEMLRTTGIVVDSQLFQLKAWPFVLWPKVKYTLSIDPSKMVVDYSLSFGKSKPAHQAEAFSELEKSVQWLLGKEWLLLISVGNKKVFKGARKISEVKAEKRKIYDPFIKCMATYIGGENPKVEDPPSNWTNK